jgi:hypothetical protein
MRRSRSILGLTFGFVAGSSILFAIAAAVSKRHLVSSGTEKDNTFDLVAIFDGIDFVSTAPAFRRGSLLTWYGGGQIDLRGATLDPAGAELSVRALFGGGQIIVPATWRVEQRITAFLGGVSDSRAKDETQEGTGPALRLTGWAVFGGIDVVSEPRHDEFDVEVPAPATS